MKKVFVGAALATLTLSSCAVGGTSDYASLYDAHVKARLTQMESALADAGLNRHVEWAGSIESTFVMPQMLSGSFMSDMEVLVNGMSASEVIFKKPTLRFDGAMGAGGVSADEVAIVTHMGDQVMRLKNVTSDLFTSEQKAVFQEFNEKWMSMSSAPEGMSESERLGYEMGKRFLTLTRADIEQLLTSHKIFVSTGGATASGDVLVFPVTLDHDQVVDLFNGFAQKLAQRELTAEERKNLQNELKNVQIKGTLGFKSNDAHYVALNLDVMDGEIHQSKISLESQKEHTAFRIDAIKSNSAFVMNYTKKGDTRSLMAEALVDGKSQGTLTADIVLAAQSIKNMNAKIQADAFSAGLTYARTADGFNGELTLPMGKVNFSGVYADKKLANLVINGNMMGMAAIDVNLAPSNGMARGPVKLMVQGQEVFSASVGLDISEGKSETFGFVLEDIVTQGQPLSGAKFTLSGTQKEKETSRKVAVPKIEASFEEFIQKMPDTGVLMDADIHSEDDMGVMMDGEEMSLDMDGSVSVQGIFRDVPGIEQLSDAEVAQLEAVYTSLPAEEQEALKKRIAEELARTPLAQ